MMLWRTVKAPASRTCIQIVCAASRTPAARASTNVATYVNV